MMNFQTISFLKKYKITSVAVTMYFQATVRDEPTILDWGDLSDTTKVGVPYRAARHPNERRNSGAVMSATSSIYRALETMQPHRHNHARHFVAVLVLDEYWAEVVYDHIRERRNLGDSRAR